MTSSTSGGKALLILTNAGKQGGNKALRSSTVNTEEENLTEVADTKNVTKTDA